MRCFGLSVIRRVAAVLSGEKVSEDEVGVEAGGSMEGVDVGTSGLMLIW